MTDQEIRIFLAERVMGWKRHPTLGSVRGYSQDLLRFRFVEESTGDNRNCWDPLHEIRDAYDLVDRLAEMEYEVIVLRTSRGKKSQTTVEIRQWQALTIDHLNAGTQPTRKTLICEPGEFCPRTISQAIWRLVSTRGIEEPGSALWRKARSFAVKAHGEQRYGKHPYAFHLDEVAACLKEFGFTEPHLLAAAYLHDVLEDTDTVAAELIMEFPNEVTNIVKALTKPKGVSRLITTLTHYVQIPKVPGAVPVKLADRISNMRNCLGYGKEGRTRMYWSEYSGFRQMLYTDDPRLAPLWAELDRLAATAA